MLSGDAQPLDVVGMHQLAGEILQAIQSEGVTDVISLAAFVGDTTEKYTGLGHRSRIGSRTSGFWDSPAPQRGYRRHERPTRRASAPLQYARLSACLGTSTGADLVDIPAAMNLLYAIRDLFKLDLDFSMMESIIGEPDEPVPEEVDMNYC